MKLKSSSGTSTLHLKEDYNKFSTYIYQCVVTSKFNKHFSSLSDILRTLCYSHQLRSVFVGPDNSLKVSLVTTIDTVLIDKGMLYRLE